MASAADELSDNIREQFLQCKICLDGLKEPKTLPCLHTFCAECITYYIEHNRIDNRKFACPMCRRHIYIPKNGIDGFPDSFFLQTLNDIVINQQMAPVRPNECGICKFKDGNVDATVVCVDCKIELCEECAGSHTGTKVTEGHTMLPLVSQSGSTSRENFCRVHRGETIKYYCETCNSPICLPCTFLDHKGHEIEEIKAVRASFSQDMETLVMQSQDNILQLSEAKDDMCELENELFVRKELAKTEIRRCIQDLIRSINDQEGRLLAEIDCSYDTVSVGRDRQQVERTIFRLQRAHDFAKQLLSEDTSPITQLVNRTEAKENLQQAVNYELPDIMVHASKLDQFVTFLPGKMDIRLGSLLKCNGDAQGQLVTGLRHIIPSTKAIYLHKLKTTEEGGFGQVRKVAIMPNGDLVVLVDSGKKVRLFNTRGKAKLEFGDDDELLHPEDMVITRDGEIAVVDSGYMSIKIFDAFGTRCHCFGGEDLFEMPVSIAQDHLGRYLVADKAKQQISVHRQNGEHLLDVAITDVAKASAICCQNNKLFVADHENQVLAIYAYSKDGVQYIAKLSTPSAGLGEFLDCSGICVDRNGALLVSDMFLDKIHVFNTAGEMSSIVASGKTFLRPSAIATSPDRLLAVAQKGVTLDGDQPNSTEVCVYRMVRSDI